MMTCHDCPSMELMAQRRARAARDAAGDDPEAAAAAAAVMRHRYRFPPEVWRMLRQPQAGSAT